MPPVAGGFGGSVLHRIVTTVLPPRGLLRIGWAFHKALRRLSGGRLGTSRPGANRLGTLFLVTTGRSSGRARRNAAFYLDEAGAFAVIASNAGADRDPGWWQNLQVQPDATVELEGRQIPVRAREATGDERDRIYARFEAVSRQFTTYRESTSRTIPVVLLERRGESVGSDPATG